MLTWAQVALLALLQVGYLRRTLTLSRAGAPVAAGRIACFSAGTLTIAIAVIVLDGPASELIYMHTIEHLLIADIATLMIAFGLTERMLRRGDSIPPPAWLRSLTRPPLALSLWAIDFAGWLTPPAYEAALSHAWLHLLQHILLVALGLNMWISLLGVAGSRLGLRGRLTGILATRMLGAGLGLAGIWTSAILYPGVIRYETATGTAPLADQGIAGAIMLAEMALLAIAALLFEHVRLHATESGEHAPEGPAGVAIDRPLPVESG